MKTYVVDNTKIYCQNFLPFPGFLAMALYGVIFWRQDYESYLKNSAYKTYVKTCVNHENIHKAQMKDFCSFIPIGGTIFYILYFFEWLFKLIPCLFKGANAYRNISAEVEAYSNEKDYEYLQNRKKFAWMKNIFKITKLNKK